MERENPELSAYLDDELSPAARREVESRLDTDAEYAQELRALQRIRTMILTSIVQPGFHDALMERIQREPRKLFRFPYRFAASLAAAAALIALAAYSYFASTPPPQTPRISEAPAVVPPQEKPDAPDAPRFAAVDEPPAPALPAPETAVATLPKIEVLGTVTGADAQALLRIDGGATKTVAVGDEVLPGVQLLAVEPGQITLLSGLEEIVLQTGRATPDPGAVLDGTWRMLVVRDDVTSTGGLVKISHEGNEIRAHVLSQGGDGGEQLIGTLHVSGANVTITGSGENTPSLTGTISNQGNTLELTMMQINAEVEPDRFRLERIPEDDIQQLAAQQTALAQCQIELKELYKVLNAFAGENHAQFPSSLAMLTPPANFPDLFSSTPERKLTYHGGRQPTLPDDAPELPAYEPAATYPDRLMQHEEMLKRMNYGGNLWPELLAELEFPEAKVKGSLMVNGAVRAGMEDSDGAGGFAGDQQLAAMRASDQNNLKQMGLIIKMFMNEHRGFSPPGFLSVYPEYLTDPSVLTSPKDEPQTESYEYLLPASNLDALALEAVEDPNNPAGLAKAQSEIPIMLNKTDWPDGGRNMLFADGHVEYTRDWREELKKLP